MPSPNANVIKMREFDHRGVKYIVVAFEEPGSDDVRVEVTEAGRTVVITYPDGHKGSLGYLVTLHARLGLRSKMGISAIDEAMATAEEDVRRLVKAP